MNRSSRRGPLRLLALAAALCLLLSGCGSGGSTATSETPGSTAVDADLLAVSDGVTSVLTSLGRDASDGRTRAARDTTYPYTSTDTVEQTLFGEGGGTMVVSGISTVTVYTPATGASGPISSLPEYDCRVTLIDFTPRVSGSSLSTLPKLPLHLTGPFGASSQLGNVTLTGPITVTTEDSTEVRLITITIHPPYGISVTTQAYGPGGFGIPSPRRPLR